MNLWQHTECAPWHTAADHYVPALRVHIGEGLIELDSWYRTQLPERLAARHPPYLTHEELIQVVAWKMKRGVWRARNRALVAGNSAPLVEQVSAEAFAAIPDPRRPLVLLCELSGVGPATASAALAAHRPDLYPFFDEVVAQQIPNLGPVAWTLPYYLRYAEALHERAAQLTAECTHQPWTAHDVSQALWAAGVSEGLRRGPGALPDLIRDQHPA